MIFEKTTDFKAVIEKNIIDITNAASKISLLIRTPRAKSKKMQKAKPVNTII